MPLIDVLDEQGLRTGIALSRAEIHRFGHIHRAVHLYLFDSHSNILLQRRSRIVDHYPNLYSISLTGHVDAGENSSQALYREIQEELGLNAREMNIEFLFCYRRDATVTSSYIDRQFNDVYAGWYEFDIAKLKFSPNEVSELTAIPFAEFQRMATTNDSDLAPVYGNACQDVVYFLQSRLQCCNDM